MLLWGAIGAAVLNVIALLSIGRTAIILRAAQVNGEILLAVTAKLWRAVLRLVAALVIIGAVAGAVPHEAVAGVVVVLIWVVSILDWIGKVAGEHLARERLRARGRT